LDAKHAGRDTAGNKKRSEEASRSSLPFFPRSSFKNGGFREEILDEQSFSGLNFRLLFKEQKYLAF